MNATKIITALLHDPKSFRTDQTIRMLYIEPIGLCDSEDLTRDMETLAIWESRTYGIQNRTKRFNYVAIGRGDAAGSKVVDLRDAVLVAPNTEFIPLELR
jgi:hypothetical protein